jgi:hypothetical protein
MVAGYMNCCSETHPEGATGKGIGYFPQTDYLKIEKLERDAVSALARIRNYSASGQYGWTLVENGDLFMSSLRDAFLRVSRRKDASLGERFNSALEAIDVEDIGKENLRKGLGNLADVVNRNGHVQ